MLQGTVGQLGVRYVDICGFFWGGGKGGQDRDAGLANLGVNIADIFEIRGTRWDPCREAGWAKLLGVTCADITVNIQRTLTVNVKF